MYRAVRFGLLWSGGGATGIYRDLSLLFLVSERRGVSEQMREAVSYQKHGGAGGRQMAGEHGRTLHE